MSRFGRLRVKPADFHPSWYHRPVMLLVVVVGGYMTIDGIRELVAGHWWGIYFAIFAVWTVAAARMDVAIQRAQRRDKIAELERELGIAETSHDPVPILYLNEYGTPRAGGPANREIGGKP